MTFSKTFITCLLLIASAARSQSLKIVRDSLTNKPIPYVNIWVENEMTGTTSNEKGEFSFQKDPIGKAVIFSSIGYKKEKLIFTNHENIIYLTPEAVVLNDVMVTSRKSLRRKIGEFKSSGIRHYFACSGFPYIIGKYFINDEPKSDRFVEEIEIFTWSKVKKAKLNIRLYKPTEEGNNFELIYHDNIITSVKKGRVLTKIDVSGRIIQMPKTGLLVAIEFLIIETNRHEYVYTMEGKKKKLHGISYEPSIGTMPKETSENSWQYGNGRWKNVSRMDFSRLPEYTGKFAEPAIKITLSD